MSSGAHVPETIRAQYHPDYVARMNEFRRRILMSEAEREQDMRDLARLRQRDPQYMKRQRERKRERYARLKREAAE